MQRLARFSLCFLSWTVLPLMLLQTASAQTQAATLSLEIEIPQLNVAEYHRPYVAVWIEKDGKEVVADLAVWYDMKMRQNEGESWLKDLRQWWRRSGRNLEMPVDGVSGATRPVGKHRLSFEEGKPPLKKLAPGKYQLNVEASREVGGREVVKIDFQWHPEKNIDLEAKGKSELGLVVLNLAP